MPRFDYDFFIKNFKSNNDRYEVCSFFNDKLWKYPFAKIVDKKTVVFEKLLSGETLNSNIGIFLDIFPIDACSDNPEKDIKMIKTYNYILISHFSIDFKNPIKKFVSLVVKKLFSIQFAQKNIEKILYTNNFGSTKKAGCVTGVYGLKEVYDTDVFTDYIELEFEGRKVMCIKQYQKFLSQHYGINYMELPSIENRVSHSLTAFLNIEVL